jgi:2Fe-2S ferredoxin
MSHNVKILPEGKVIEVKDGENILQVLRDQSIYVKSSCGGHASCSDCIIKVTSGDEYLNEIGFEEIQLLGNVFHITKERLACQLQVTGPITIDISEHDLGNDEERLKGKKHNLKNQKTVRRNREEVREKRRLKDEEKLQKEKEKEIEDGKWEGHWNNKDEDADPAKFKKMGGGKRPKLFRTDELDEEGND